MSCPACTKKDSSEPAKKQICGFRVWYFINDKILEFRGDTFADWDAMPEVGFQEANLYENWCAGPKYRYQVGLHGHDYYFCAPGPDGLIFGKESRLTPDEIRVKYPGASVKIGTWVTLGKLQEISDITKVASEF